MFFKRKEAVKTIEFNHAYEEFQNNMNIILLCVDDDLKFDVRHPVDAQCYPARLIDQHAKRDLDPTATYYVYALAAGTAHEGARKLLKAGFKVFDLGSLVDFRGPEEGNSVKQKRHKH